jgi:type IV pilus assembly protein PilC
VFDKVTTNVIKASEEAGTLDVTLKDIRDNVRKSMEFSDKVKSSMTYPIFIMMVFFGMMAVNLFFVMPKISMVFTSLKVKLPLPTKMMIAASNFVSKNPIPIAATFILAAAIFMFFYTQKRSWFLNIIYSLPLISNLVNLIDLTQFTRSLYLLLTSGIPIVEALDLTSEVALMKRTNKVIFKAKEMVLSGKPLSQGLRSSKSFIPLIMIKLIEAGEKTGTLDRSMEEISEYFDYQVTNTLKTLMTLLEPVMLVIVGLLVGGMMLAIIAPIYSVIGSMGSMR